MAPCHREHGAVRGAHDISYANCLVVTFGEVLHEVLTSAMHSA